MKRPITVALPLAQSQNPDLAHIINTESDRLRNFIRKRVPTAEDAEDILNDVFYQMIEAHRLMKPIERMTSWLFTVARNKITDKYRKKKPVSFTRAFGQIINDDGDSMNINEILQDKSAVDGETAYYKKQVWKNLNEAIEELPEKQRYVFVKHEFEGVSFNKMAEETGETVNTLLSRKRYAVLHLRKRMNSIYQEMIAA